MELSQCERLLFPAFLLAFQIAFLILFGLLVEYDASGAGQAGNTELLQVANVNNLTGGNPSDVALKLTSAKEITKFYPSELRTLARSVLYSTIDAAANLRSCDRKLNVHVFLKHYITSSIYGTMAYSLFLMTLCWEA